MIKQYMNYTRMPLNCVKWHSYIVHILVNHIRTLIGFIKYHNFFSFGEYLFMFSAIQKCSVYHYLVSSYLINKELFLSFSQIFGRFGLTFECQNRR